MLAPRIVLAAMLLALPWTSSAQSPLRQRVDEYRRSHDVEIVRELSDFLAIRNLASDSVNIRRNPAHTVELLGLRGIEGRLLESPSGGPPAVFGELKTPGATRTIVLYAHTTDSRWTPHSGSRRPGRRRCATSSTTRAAR